MTERNVIYQDARSPRSSENSDRDFVTSSKKRRLTQAALRNLTGWGFVIPASILILIMSFWPMIDAFFISLQTGKGQNLTWAEPIWRNYARLFQDSVFHLTILNTFIYLIVQVPVMLFLAMVLANLLNNPKLRFKAFFRTAIFLPAAVSLVAYSLVFRTMFATEGAVNSVLKSLGLISENIDWLANPGTARMVIILGLLWRWTGYNMIFYLAALQTVDPATIEAARIDGAGPAKTFFYVTMPQLKPMILLTTIMSTNGTLQLFDEPFNLTGGGPSNTTMSMSMYLYNTGFNLSDNFGYASAISYVIFIMVAVLALAQMKVGDKRD